MPNPDARFLPNYAFSEAAHYVHVPTGTLRAWALGHSASPKTGQGRFKPVLTRTQGGGGTGLSFMNLVEAHTLASLRKQFSLQQLRKAVAYMQEAFGSQYPLAQHRFETDGVDLFLAQLSDRAGSAHSEVDAPSVIAVTRAGQISPRELLERYLERVEHDDSGFASRFYPFTRSPGSGQPKHIVIDPTVSFGRPTLVGTGIPTFVIADRYLAGESVRQLATEYSRSTDEIEEALRCELNIAAA